MPEGKLYGVVTAVVTPFRPDERIDYRVWQELLEIQIASGVHGLLVAGGQGEFFALNEEERKVAARFSAQTIGGRIPLYVNAGAVTTLESVRLAQQAEAEGASAVVVITPYFVWPSADELVDHYVEISHSVRIPVLAYNNPERTGVDLTPEVARRIAVLCENFVGLKDSSGRLEAIAGYTAAGLKVFVGRDHQIVDALNLGAVGTVTACANVMPRALVNLYDAFREGGAERALPIQAAVARLRGTFGLGTFPSVIKEALQLTGLNAGRCRRPVGPMSVEARYKLLEVLETIRAEGHLLPQAKLAAR